MDAGENVRKIVYVNPTHNLCWSQCTRIHEVFYIMSKHNETIGILPHMSKHDEFLALA
jgi:hypothetical protein